MDSTKSSYDLVIRADRVVTPAGERPAAVAVSGGTIALVTDKDAPLSAAEELTLAADLVLLPGVVDSHVHINEPGRTEWEGFATATRAAVAGGTTTLADMPLNSIPPTIDTAAMQLKLDATVGKLSCDVGLLGGAVPDNIGGLAELDAAGVVGFKSFLAPSGVDEFGHIDEAQLEKHLAELAGFGGLLMVHAEDPAVLEAAPAPQGRSYAAFVASRPEQAEVSAIRWAADVAERTGARLHVVHVASADALAEIAAAKAAGTQLTAETCPHYLHFAAEEIPDGGTQYKCCPPIRAAAIRERLWGALVDGTLDWVASDHSPATVDVKGLETGDFGTAWGGIASVQLLLNVVWNGARQRGIPIADVARWLSERPAAALGLPAKGAIEQGRDADLVVFAPDEAHTIDVRELQHRNPVSPYDGVELYGVVKATYLRGHRVDLGDPRGQVVTHKS